VVVNFRSDHTPMVLTGETREMQEKATPAKCPSNKQRKASVESGAFCRQHRKLFRGSEAPNLIPFLSIGKRAELSNLDSPALFCAPGMGAIYRVKVPNAAGCGKR